MGTGADPPGGRAAAAGDRAVRRAGRTWGGRARAGRRGSSRPSGTSAAGRTAPAPNRALARSTARSASRQPCGRSPRASWRCPLAAGTSPSTRTPTSRSRARSRPETRRTARGRWRRRPGRRRCARARVRERVIVVKSANRTLRTTVRPTQARARSRAADALGQPEQLAQHDLRVVDVAWRTSPPRRCSSPARRAPPGGGRGPRPARAGDAPGGLPERPLQGVDRGVGEVGDGAEPEPQQHLLGLLAHAPQRADRQRVQEVDGLVAGHDEQAVGLGRGRRRAWRRTWWRRPRPSR